MTNPEDFSDQRGKSLERWQRNRAHCSGSDTIKSYLLCETYLPRYSKQSDEDYERFLMEVDYFPAAAQTLKSHVGLIFRKMPSLQAPDRIVELKDAITDDGLSLEQVAKWALSEQLTTNDGGILIDHPTAPISADTVAKRDALDLRPYMARFKAEDIREKSYAVINGRRTLVKVRLLVDETQAIELALIEGEYKVTVRQKDKSSGQWVVTYSDFPKVNGNRLKRIPFVSLADENDDGAPFDEICAMNGVHYLTSAKLEKALNWCSQAKLIVRGLDQEAAKLLDMSPEAAWVFESEKTDTRYVEFKGTGITFIENKLERLRDTMSQIGSRMLASEKAAAEAAETVARRQASENSILAASSRHISDKMTAALKLVAMFEGIDEEGIAYSLNADFVPNAADPAYLSLLDALNDKGKLPDPYFFDALVKGEIISEAVSYDEWQAHRDFTDIDPPIGD